MLILDDLPPDVLRNVELHHSFQRELSLSRGSIAKKGVTIGGPATVGQDATSRADDCTRTYPSIGNKSVIEKREIENPIIIGWLIIAIEDGIIGILLGPRSHCPRIGT